MATSILDDANLSRFHVKTTLYGTAGQFCDGYILGIIVPALPVFARTHEVSPLMSALLGASALVGLFFGASVFGWITDRVGRRRMFIVDLLAIVVLSLLQLTIDDAIVLLVLRLLLGFAVGADYAIAPTLIAEFTPRRHRATLVAFGPALWTVGYVAAFTAGTALEPLGDDSWRWMLVSSTVPALIVLLVRLRTPESPRWLYGQGRTEEALDILRRYVHPDATVADLAEESSAPNASLREAFSPAHRRRLAFVCLFWFCQVVPYFAVFTFLPTIMSNLGVQAGLWQTLNVNAFLLAGGILGIVTINLLSRRTYILTAFSVLTATTLIIGLWQGAPAHVVIGLFALFAFVSSAMSALDTVYPTELFPTHIRATATGISVAFSRVGAAIGTFLLPLGMSAYGVHTTTLVTAGLAAVGLAVSAAYAPETRHLTLAAASKPAVSASPTPERSQAGETEPDPSQSR